MWLNIKRTRTLTTILKFQFANKTVLLFIRSVVTFLQTGAIPKGDESNYGGDMIAISGLLR